MRGIECIFQNITDVLTCLQIIKNVFEKCYFRVVDHAVYLEGKRKILPERIDCHNFNNLTDSPYVYERLVLNVFLPNSAFVPVTNYSDFLNSTCRAVILIYDAVYVEVYVKEQADLETVYMEMKRKGNVSITLKNHSDSREEFYV